MAQAASTWHAAALPCGAGRPVGGTYAHDNCGGWQDQRSVLVPGGPYARTRVTVYVLGGRGAVRRQVIGPWGARWAWQVVAGSPGPRLSCRPAKGMARWLVQDRCPGRGGGGAAG